MPDNAPACATIIAFIRRQLPAGSPDAFAKEELDAFRAEGGPVSIRTVLEVTQFLVNLTEDLVSDRLQPHGSVGSH